MMYFLNMKSEVFEQLLSAWVAFKPETFLHSNLSNLLDSFYFYLSIILEPLMCWNVCSTQKYVRAIIKRLITDNPSWIVDPTCNESVSSQKVAQHRHLLGPHLHLRVWASGCWSAHFVEEMRSVWVPGEVRSVPHLSSWIVRFLGKRRRVSEWFCRI